MLLNSYRNVNVRPHQTSLLQLPLGVRHRDTIDRIKRPEMYTQLKVTIFRILTLLKQPRPVPPLLCDKEFSDLSTTSIILCCSSNHPTLTPNFLHGIFRGCCLLPLVSKQTWKDHSYSTIRTSKEKRQGMNLADSFTRIHLIPTSKG